MKLRPEFKLLDDQFKQLYANKDIDLEFLSRVGDHIRLCEYIADENVESAERRIVTRTTYWWKKRMNEIADKMESEPAPESLQVVNNQEVNPARYNFTENDRRFLRSLRIAEDDSLENKDDGA